MQDTNLNHNPLLSVVIPMYNCAPVITRCLDSIDYPEAEIIVVNDGSTDGSADIVRDYVRALEIGHLTLENGQQRGKSVRLVNKENGGVSSARNLGIAHARGKYILFIDADDYITNGGLMRIVQLVEEKNADVVKFKWKNVQEGDDMDRSSVDDFPIQIIETTGRDVLNRHDISDYVVWDGVYRRDVIVDNHLQFMTDLTLHEDDVFMGMLYCHAGKVIATNLPLYRYVVASNSSSTHRQTIEKQRKLIQSGLLAVRYRSQYVQRYYPEVMQEERLKYMRWVCAVKTAIAAEMSIEEYMALLEEYHKEGVYPLDYRWIKIAGWEYMSKAYLKCALKTWMVNHPRVAYRMLDFKF